MMNDDFALRNRVKEIRERLGIRQADLAADAGVTRQTVIAIEKGRLTPSVLIGLRIARVLREPVDYVFYLERAPVEQPPPAPPPQPHPKQDSEPGAVWDFP